MAYPLDDTLSAGQTGHLTDHTALHKRYNSEGPKVKADFGAVGDSHHNNGGGTDDTAAFQNAIDAASSSNTGQVLVEPGSYRITAPLKMFKADFTGGAIRLRGLGGSRNAATLRGPTLVWDGPTDGTARAMLDYDTPNSNIAGCPIEDIVLAGRWITNASAIRFRKKVDLTSYLANVWFQRWAGASTIYNLGSTNGYIYGCRWDEMQGFPISMTLDVGQSFLSVKDSTFASNQDGQMGFFYVERGADFNSKAQLHFENLNIEVQNHLAIVEAGGTDPADRRGLFQFKTDAAHGSLQYRVTFTNIRRDGVGGLNSYSMFLLRGDGTAVQRGRRISIEGTGLNGLGGGDGTAATGAVIPIGNVAAAQKPGAVTNAIPMVRFRSTNTELSSSERPVPWVYEGAD